MQEISLLDALYPAQPPGRRAAPTASRTSSPAEFAATYGPAAERAAAALGVDSRVILGQWGLETGWGKSIIPGTNNLGNIKDFAGGGVGATDNMTGSRDRYRTYPSADHFADDYVSLVQRKYPGALNAGADPARFTAGLKGYAEDPRYADKVAQASRMAGAAPSPFMAAAGRAVGALLPSANAAQPRNDLQRTNMGQPSTDLTSPEWEALAQKFGPQATKQGPEGSDPWAELNAQFSQPAQPARAAESTSRPGQREAFAVQREPITSSTRKNDLTARALRAVVAPIPGVGQIMAMSDDPAGRAAGMVAGGVSAAAGIGNTLLSGIMGPRDLPSVRRGGLSSLVTGEKPQTIGDRFKAQNEAAAGAFKAENQDRPGFTTGELATQIGMTAPVGATLAAPVRAAAPLIGRLAPAAQGLADSIASGGLRTGMNAAGSFGARAADMGTRIAGGAISGGASAGLINPSDAGMGALIGGALPPVVKGLHGAGDLVGAGARALLKPQIARDGEAIVNAGGYAAQDLPAVRGALAQQGPQIVSAPLTAPQILQNPGISQLGRTLRNAGDTSLLTAEQLQDAARLEALNRVSPVTGTVRQAADNFGNTAQPQILAADAAARARTSRAFDAVDPFGEARLELPVNEMGAAVQKYQGRGTFGQSGAPGQAVQTAREIGTETLPPVQAQAMPSTRKQGEDLVSALKSMGGIKQDSRGAQALAGELHDLKQAPGMRSVMQNGRGQSLDTLAQAMHARGFIPDDDPATLLNALRAHASGDRVFSVASERGGAMRAGVEGAMGDAPGAETIARAVPFNELQNLRSSIKEASRGASKYGPTRASAALDAQQAAIDARVADAAAGNVRPGEFFPKDMADSWKIARDLKQRQVDTFRTGPQASMFRRGADNLPAVNGGELAPKFFSPQRSQSADIQAFNRVATPETTALLKNYAITDAANQTDALGRLTNSKFNNWRDVRSGAIGGLLDAGEQAQLRGVGRSLEQADSATRLGMAAGSNTAQNAMGLGLLDSPLLGGIASRTPVLGRFTGPMLDALRASARKGKVDRLGNLLADPEALERAIAAYHLASQGRPFGLGRTASPLLEQAVRSAPLLSNDR